MKTYTPLVFRFCLTSLLLAATASSHGAIMTPISVSGFNRDVVIENTASGPPYTGAALNFNSGENNAFYQTNLPGKTRGLPLLGNFTNAADGTIFQLQPYTANNVLDLNPDTGLTNGTLFLAAPRIYDFIAVIANSGNSDAIGNASLTLHFNDGTTFVTNYYAPDWFNNSNLLYSIALQGFERIDLNSGAVSGAPSNPRFYQTAIVLTNIAGGNKRISSITFGKPGAARSTGIYALSGLTNPSQTTLTFTPATLTNLPATSITTTSAVLNAQVLSTGNDAPLVTLYYGPVDGGTNPSAWSNSISVGWQTGSFSQSVSGLAFSSTYFYAVKGVNVAGTSWATPSRSFATLTPTLAVVTNQPATAVLANSASVSGKVLSSGGDAPSITIFYGPVNGGTNPSAWSNSLPIGIQGGTFIRGIFGLNANTTYYFSARAVNGAGTSWGTPVQSFTTLTQNPPPVTTAVMTHHNDNFRTGDNLNESILNTGNVNTNTFGLLYTRPVDDQIYAQPLIATNITIPGQGTHNLIIVATVNNTVYAFDADNPAATAPYWQTSFLDANSVAPSNTDMTGACGGNYRDFSGHMGIVGTPVIDPTTGTIYLVVRTLEFGANFVQRLHALDITTGADKLTPVDISGSFGGATFDPQRNNQRSAITLANGRIFIAWSSHCDWGPYHGWVMAYDAATLTQLAVYCATPTGNNAGIWMSGQGPNADPGGNIYLTTGNGTVNTSDNRGQSFLKLDGATLNVASWFTPGNYVYLNNGDYDLGSGGLLLIPGTSLAVGGGKSGSTVSSPLYLVNRDNMGGLSAITTDTNIVQSIPVTPTAIGVNHIHGSPVWWDGPDGSYAYVWGESDKLRQYRFDRVNGLFVLPPYALSPTPAWVNGMTGGMLAISANGTNAGTGILWGSHQFTGDANQAVRPGIIHAYDAQDVSHELWNSEQFSVRDSVGSYAKFVPPTVANGKVYLATFSNRLNVYGLLPGGRPVIYQQPQSTIRFAGDPVIIAVAAGGSNPLSYQWKFNSTNNIPGATNSSYSISAAQFNHDGAYSCTISNSQGVTNTAVVTLTVLTSPTISYAQTVIADNPVAYWRLNETSGTIAHDSWGGHDGQYSNVNLGLPGYNTNDPDFAAGVGQLSPTDSYIGNIQGIDFSTFANNATFSIEAWVNGGTQIAGAGIVTFGYGNGGEQFNLDTGSGGAHAFRFSVRDANNFAHNANGNIAPSNTWQHVVGVCDEPNGFVRLYVNGASNANTTISGGIQMGTSPISIGSRQPDYRSSYTANFVGSIDEVAIYNYALSAAQVQNHYISGTNPVVRLYVQKSGPNVMLLWSPGTLQAAGTVNGVYTNVPGASSPYVVSPAATGQFYRVKVR
jgi:Concanavalin A-like lectin/glucanases superfamily/Immunoglobulin domain